MAIKERLGEKLERDIVYSLALRGFELTGCEKGEDLGSSEELILTILEKPSVARSLSAIPYLLITQPINYEYLISEAKRRNLVNKVGYMIDIATQIFRDDKAKRRELREVSKSLEVMMNNEEHYLMEVFNWEKDFLKKRASRTERKWYVYTHNKLDTYTTHFYLYYENGRYYEERGQKRRPFRTSS